VLDCLFTIALLADRLDRRYWPVGGVASGNPASSRPRGMG